VHKLHLVFAVQYAHLTSATLWHFSTHKPCSLK